MAKRTKSLAQWCAEEGRMDLISELDSESNSEEFASDYIPDRIEYNSPIRVSWICEKGHRWKCEVVGRTAFDMKCPKCFEKGDCLPIGASYGCLTIISEPIDEETNLGYIKLSRRIYKCRCKCGMLHNLDQSSFLSSKHRYCTEAVTDDRIRTIIANQKHNQALRPFAADNEEDNSEANLITANISDQNTPFTEKEALKCYCGLAVNAWLKKQQTRKENRRRVKAENYNFDFTGMTFESLEIIECIDQNHEELYGSGDSRRKDADLYKIYKLYRCRCYLCGKEHIVKCSQFHIDPPTEYGATAYNGYWSGVQCDCHKASSFQWVVNKLLFENNIPYRVEYSFPDLLGTFHTNNLKFDFAVFNADGTLKCLIECQGEQHYMPVEEFGGATNYHLQKQNDTLKRKYTQEHGIQMIEISYKDKKYEKVKAILEKHGVI